MSIDIKQNSSPKLIESVIQELQTVLKDNLAWLDYAFGKSYKLVKLVNNVEYKYPAVYAGNREYLSVLPDDIVGNISFFEVHDPQEYDGAVQCGKGNLKVKIALIFWFSLETIYENTDIIMSENIKNDILKLITTPGKLSRGRVTVEKVYEKAENIYSGYSLKQIQNQYLMFPHYGFRFECELLINELC